MRDIENYQARYNTPNFEDYQVEYRRRKLLEIMGRVKHTRILEIGVGLCPIFNYINDYEKYYFYEPASSFFDNAIELSKGDRRIEGANKPFEYNENIKLEKIDFVICASLLHEVESPLNFLREIKKIVNDNTHVFINVPNAKSFHRILAWKMGLISDLKELSERNLFYQQNTVFDLNDIIRLANESEFNVIDSGYLFIKPFTHDQMYKMMINKIIDKKVLDGLYEMTELYPELGSEIWALLKSK